MTSRSGRNSSLGLGRSLGQLVDGTQFASQFAFELVVVFMGAAWDGAQMRHQELEFG
jgi:hypothetical protein